MGQAFLSLLGAPLELTFMISHVGRSMIVPECQGHPAHDALIAVTSFSETKRNHMVGDHSHVFSGQNFLR